MASSNDVFNLGKITQEDRDFIRSRDPIAAIVLESMIKERNDQT